jgi:hypothetical protein
MHNLQNTFHYRILRMHEHILHKNHKLLRKMLYNHHCILNILLNIQNNYLSNHNYMLLHILSNLNIQNN